MTNCNLWYGGLNFDRSSSFETPSGGQWIWLFVDESGSQPTRKPFTVYYCVNRATSPEEYIFWKPTTSCVQNWMRGSGDYSEPKVWQQKWPRIRKTATIVWVNFLCAAPLTRWAISTIIFYPPYRGFYSSKNIFYRGNFPKGVLYDGFNKPTKRIMWELCIMLMIQLGT